MNFKSSSGVPSTLDLLEAVSEWMSEDLMSRVDPDLRHPVRICVAALEIARRDIELGPQVVSTKTTIFSELGVETQEALVEEIRGHLTPSRRAEVRAATSALVDAELALLKGRSERGNRT